MIELNTLFGFYPPQIAGNAAFRKHILKEYVELLSLEYLSRSPFVPHLAFIGGTNLRLALERLISQTDFNLKRRDFEHLLFQSTRSEQILYFETFMKSKLG